MSAYSTGWPPTPPCGTNSPTAVPRTKFWWAIQTLRVWRRRQQYFCDDGDIWEADFADLYDDYAPILGKETCQQLTRKNSEAWRSFFRLLEKYHDDGNPTVTEKPSPPSYWGNRDDGYDLHGLVRNDLYTLDWDETRSTLEFGVGDVLENRYNFKHQERLTLEINGNPRWNGDDSRMELVYDEAADRIRVKHPVRIQPARLQEQRRDALTHTLHPGNATHTAAIDVGANNTFAIVTDHGETAVYHARPEFDRFRRLSERIADFRSQLPDDRYSSRRIGQLYDERRRKRDHARDAAVKHAAEWLLARNIDTVYLGDLTGVLDAHWSTSVNEKTHSFWSHRQLLNRLGLTFGDVGIDVVEVSEADSSSSCPACESETVRRQGDEFRCRDCELEAHSDVVGAWNMLQSVEGPMARPAALRAGRRRDAPESGAYWEWDGHEWRPAEFGERSRPSDQTGIGEPASSQPG